MPSTDVTLTTVRQNNDNGLLTIFCDVSFCERTRTSGWGGWYRGPGMEKGKFIGGFIDARCVSSNDSEFWGLALALKQALWDIRDQKLTAVVVQCDNLAALAWLSKYHPKAAPVSRKHGTHEIPAPSSKVPSSMLGAVSIIRKIDPGLLIWLKHVKGHEKGATSRSAVNEQCDRLAKHYRTSGRPTARPGGLLPRGRQL